MNADSNPTRIRSHFKTDLPSLREVRSAQRRIAKHLWYTPVLATEAFPDLYLKMECWQRTGSFKIRGALSKILMLDKSELSAGLVTASAGNHGLGVLEAANLVKARCHVFVPINASPAKVKALQQGGAQVHVEGRDYDESEQAAVEWSATRGAQFIHAFDDPEVIAGQATVALELLEQVEGLRVIYVPIGGGGLIAGVASVVKTLNPEVRVVGVQPEACPAMARSLEAGRVVETPFTDTLADGLAGRFVSERTLRACQLWVDEVVLVSERQIRHALRWFVDSTHTIAEGSAVVGIAAALEHQEPRPAATIVTGRNIDTKLLLQVLNEEVRHA